MGCVDAISKTTTEKVQKEALRAGYLSSRERGRGPASPLDAVPAREETA